MRRFVLITLSIVLLTPMLGCIAPHGIGCGRYGDHCYDCEGGFGPRYAATGPLDALRQVGRSAVCGGGCGEVYYDEWISTPPYATDPCYGSEFTGGGCRERIEPLCYPPGGLLAALYGQRFYEGCDDCCDTCSGGLIEGSLEGEAYDVAPGQEVIGRRTNRSSSMIAAQPKAIAKPQVDPITRQATVTAKSATQRGNHPVSTARSQVPQPQGSPTKTNRRNSLQLQQHQTTRDGRPAARN